MSNEMRVTPWTDPAVRPGSDHPAGEIRLPDKSAVGRRARLLAGLDGIAQDESTIIETSFSLSLI